MASDLFVNLEICSDCHKVSEVTPLLLAPIFFRTANWLLKQKEVENSRGSTVKVFATGTTRVVFEALTELTFAENQYVVTWWQWFVFYWSIDLW